MAARMHQSNIRDLYIVQRRKRCDLRTSTGVEYNIFDSERYVLTLDNRSLRDVAAREAGAAEAEGHRGRRPGGEAGDDGGHRDIG